MKTSFAISAAALMTLTGLASAQSAGDILFVSNDFTRTSGASPDTIGFIPAFGGAETVLFSEMNTRFRHVNTGPGGGYFFTDAEPVPSTSTGGAVFQIDGLFSGFGSRTNVSTGNLVNGAFDLSYHSPSNSFIVVNNPFGTGAADNPEDGLTAVALPTGAQTQLFQEPVATPGDEPRYDAGTDIVADPFRPNSYYVLTLNDGIDSQFSDSAPSLLHRLTVNDDLTSATVELVQDFSASVTGFAESINSGKSITVDPMTGDVLLTAENVSDGTNNGNVFRIGIDGAGDSTGVSIFADVNQLQVDAGFDSATLDEIEWDPFNNRWLFAEFVSPSVSNELGRISAINADGTGYEVLASGFSVNDIIVIPTPGAASVLALAGLAATRRRRNA